MHNILIFSDSRSYISISFEQNLVELGYKVIIVGTKIEEIQAVKGDVSLIIVYPDSELLEKKHTLALLAEKALDNNTPFFVIGDLNELAEIRSIIPNYLIQKELHRPINVKDIGIEVDEYVKKMHSERKKVILVVDDSGPMLRSVKGWLGHKYKVVLANTGDLAIKYLSLNHPDLVLLDYEMPVMNGKEVLEKIRSKEDLVDLPVIFLTGKNDKDSIQQVLELKPDGYILKSTKPELVVKTVDDFFIKKMTER